MPILNIPVKEWGADLAEQAKRKAQAAMQQVQDAGSDAIAESQRQAKEARDEWMKTQIDAAMNPIREAGHAAAEGLSALGDRAQEAGQTAQQNLQENASAVAEAPVGQAIGEKASGLGTFAQGVRQDLRKGADAAVAADTAMDTALSERDAADRASAPTIPEEVSAPPSFQVPGALPAMTADTMPNLVEFPTNVAKNYLGSMGKSAEDLTDPEELGRTASAAQEIAPEVQNPSLAIARAASDPAYRDELATKKLPAAGQVLKTVGDIGNVVPNVGEQLENVAASVALEATKDTGLPDPVKAGIAMAAGSGVPTNLLKRAFKVPGGLSSQLDGAGRMGITDGAGAGAGDIGDIPEPTQFPEMHRPGGARPPGQPEHPAFPDPDLPAFPDPHGEAPPPVEVEFPDRPAGQPRDPNGLMGPTREEAFGPRQPTPPPDDDTSFGMPDAGELGPGPRPGESLQDYTARLKQQDPLGMREPFDPSQGPQAIRPSDEPPTSRLRPGETEARPIGRVEPPPSEGPPPPGTYYDLGEDGVAPLGPERANFVPPGTVPKRRGFLDPTDEVTPLEVGVEEVVRRLPNAAIGGMAADRQDEDDTGWERAARIATGAALGATNRSAQPLPELKGLARGVARSAARGGDVLGVRAGAARDPGRRITAEGADELRRTYTANSPEPEPIDVFYSKLSRELDTLPERGTIAQVRATLKNRGVKPDEMAWSGMDDLLRDFENERGANGRITKKELQDNLQFSRVDLREVVNETAPEAEAAKQRHTDLWNEYRTLQRRDADLSREYRRLTAEGDTAGAEAVKQEMNAAWQVRASMRGSLDEARQAMEKAQVTGAEPQYENYSQPTAEGKKGSRPGYREILLTTRNRIEGGNYESSHWGTQNIPLHARVTDRTLPDGKRVLHIEEMQSDWHQAGRDQGYRYPYREVGRALPEAKAWEQRIGVARDAQAKHWADTAEERRTLNRTVSSDVEDDDPLTTNAALSRLQALDAELDQLVAARQAVGQEAKDWARGNPARHEALAEARVGAARAKERELFEARNASQDRFDDEFQKGDIDDIGPEAIAASEETSRLSELYSHARGELEAAKEDLNTIRYQKGTRVPSGPWQKSWPELGMKRLIRMAAEEGYDAVSWTPGKVQQDRYGRSVEQAVRRLEFIPERQMLRAIDHEGQIRELNGVTEDNLHNYVGQDLSQRLKATEPVTEVIPETVDDSGGLGHYKSHNLEGPDLRFNEGGSTGMNVHYDQVMPQAANKIAKPWGQRAYQGEIELSPGGERSPAHLLDITPEMRGEVTEKGFPLFVKDQQGGIGGMAVADQIAGRTLGAIQGGLVGDRQDEDDEGWDRAKRVGVNALMGGMVKPVNVKPATLAKGILRNADRLAADLGEGELGATRGRPRLYTEEMRTPPTRPPKDYGKDPSKLPRLDALPDDLVAEEAMAINSLAGRVANQMRDAAKLLHPTPTPERDAAFEAAKNIQGAYIAAAKAKMSPVEQARYDVEYNLDRQNRGKRLDTDNVRSGGSGADPVPSRIDTEEPPSGAPTSGPAEGTGTPSITRDTGDMGDEEGVTVTETPAEEAARLRRRQRALEEEGSYDQAREARAPTTAGAVSSGSEDEAARLRAARATQREASAVETAPPVQEPGREVPPRDMARVEAQATAPVREGADPDAEAPPEPVTRGPEPGPQDRAQDMGQAPSRVQSGSADEAQRKAASQARASGSEARSATPLVTEADIKAPEQPPKGGWWARNRGGIGEWANTLRYSGGLLANPATAGADFAASTAEVPWVYARNRLMDIPDSKAKWVREAEEMGLTKGYKVGSENMGELFRTGKELRELTPGAAPEDVPQSLMRRYRDEGREGMARAAGIMETPLRVRNSLDALTHGALYTQDVYRQAAKAVNKTSIDPGSDLWWKQVQEFVNKTADENLATDTPEYAARKHALLQADRSLGRNDAGALGETLSSAFKNPVMKPFFPLFKTGYNLSVRGLERSPLGVGGILFDKALGREVSAERIMDTAMGTPITAAMALYAVKSGNISGYGPDDQKTRDDLVAQGWRPFSIRTPDGRWHSYTRAGVASAPLAMAGAIGDAVQYAPPDAKSGDYMKAVGKGFGTWFGNNFLLRSVGDLGDLAADPIGKGEGYFGRMASQYTGTSSLLGTPASMLDPYQRNTAEGGVNPFVNEMIKNIPVLRQNVLEPKYDAFGKPLPNPAHGFGGLNPYTPGPSSDEIPYSTRNLRRYGGSHSAAEDAKIADAIAAWEANIEGGPRPGPEANRYISKYLGTDNVDYDFAREDAKDAEDARVAARLGR